MAIALGAALYAALFGSGASNALDFASSKTAATGQQLARQQADLPAVAPLEVGGPALLKSPIELTSDDQTTERTAKTETRSLLSELGNIPAPDSTASAQSPADVLTRSLRLGDQTSPASAAEQEDECEPGESYAYCVYTVQEGDTLSSIAAKLGLTDGYLPGWDLLVYSNAPDIVSADDFIQPGQKLRVPVVTGVVHTVLLGETVSELAEQFDVTSESIININGLGDGNSLAIGQVLLIPDPHQLQAPPVSDSPADVEPGEEVAPTPEPFHFIWPITATVRVTNYFGPNHPLGIDMGLSHAPGSPIVAAAAGKVVFAGGDPCCSYGYYVIVDHENGFKTLYGHLSRMDVSVGQYVAQGEALGPSGSTGYSTGVHLHFEVHKDGVRVDPLLYLP